MEQQRGNQIITTSFNSVPISRLKHIFLADIIGAVLFIIHYFPFWLSYTFPFTFRTFMGILSLILVVGLVIYEYLMMYKKAITGQFINVNVVPWVRLGVWIIVLIYCIIIMVWILGDKIPVSLLKAFFKIGYYFMYIVLVVSIILIAISGICLNNVKLHNLSLVKGHRTHVVQYQDQNQNYNPSGYQPQVFQQTHHHNNGAGWQAPPPVPGHR